MGPAAAPFGLQKRALLTAPSLNIKFERRVPRASLNVSANCLLVG